MSNNMEDILMDSDQDESEDEVEEVDAPKTSAVPARIPAVTTTAVKPASPSVIPATNPRPIPTATATATATFTSTTALPVMPTQHHRHGLEHNQQHSAFQPTPISRMNPNNASVMTSASASASASISPEVQIQRTVHHQLSRRGAPHAPFMVKPMKTKTSGLAQHSHVPSLSQSTPRHYPSTSTQLYRHVDTTTSPPSSQMPSHQQRQQRQQRQQQQQRPQQQQQQQQHPSSASRQVTPQQDQKSQNEQLTIFVKILLQVLSRAKDHALHKKSMNIIQEYKKKNNDGVAGYQSLHASLKSRLRSTVGEVFWKKAEEDALEHTILYNENKKKGSIIEPIKAKHGSIAVARKAAEPLRVGTQQQQQQHPSSASPQFSSRQLFKELTMQLLKYLGTKDLGMYKKARMVIKDCLKKNKDGVAGYQSLNASLKSHLRSTVGEVFWKEAEDALEHILYNENIEKGVEPIQAKYNARQLAMKVARPLRMETQQRPYHNYSTSVNYHNPQTTQLKPNGSPGDPVKINTGMPSQSTVSPMKTTKVQNKESKKPKQNIAILKHKSPTIVGAIGTNLPTTVLPSKKNTKKNPKQRKAEHVSSSRSLAGENASSYSSSKKLTSPSAPEVLKEYSERMEMVENMVDYDTSLCTLIFNEKKTLVAATGMVNIGEEQRKLLYGINKDKDDDKSDTSSLLPHFKGWGDRNILPTRAAWAKLRLREDEERQSTPTLPGQIKDNLKSPKSSWFNEEKAEEDEALALISEATQQYIKTILEAAMSSARQRMNLDGIRLWHQELAAAAVKESSAKSLPPQLITDSPLHLRLGCDVRRQCAMAEGNAAKTCQRMEEAMARKEMYDDSKKYSLDDNETLYNAGSMSELAMVSRIPNAAKNADINAKRSYEIYGGKHSSEPPLGRVPKKVKISRWDIQTCVDDPRTGMRRQKRSRLY